MKISAPVNKLERTKINCNMEAVTDDYIYNQLSPLVEVSIQGSKTSPKRKLIKKDKQQRLGIYTLDRLIGEGKCGQVRLAHCSSVTKPLAIKLLARDTVDMQMIRRLVRELQALNEIVHPHIIKIKEIVVDHQYLGLVMNWAPYGDMFRCLTHNGPVNESKAQMWLAQLVWAVDEMHSLSYVHRDIKPENVLIDEDENIILTDFEMCESFRLQGFSYLSTPCGSPTYCPPEAILSTQPFDACKADVWAIGITLYTMVAGYLPFDDREFFGNSRSEIAQLYKHISETPLKTPQGFSSQLVDLLRGMLAKNPLHRMTTNDVKRHPWLQSYAGLWECPELSGLGSSRSLRTTRFGSWPSTSSLQTVSDKMAEGQKKPVRGPIIWDPNAAYDLPTS